MKLTKRYWVFVVLLAITFVLKFHTFVSDDAEVGIFRGGSLEVSVWNPLIAEEVNAQVLNVVIDNKTYSSENYTFYMDENRNIMVPVSILRDTLDCSAHIYDGERLLVEKHNLSALFTLNELEATGNEGKVEITSAFVEIDGAYYVSLNDLSNMLGYQCSFDIKTNTLVAADLSENVNALPTRYDLREKLRISEIRSQGKYGTCWAFAALSAIESSLLPEEQYLFSVDHMSMSNSFNVTQYDGGSYTMGMAYLAAWQGPVYESEDPYGDNQTDSALEAKKHVQEMRIIPSKDLAAIKEAVFKYGGVQTSLYSSISNANGSSKYYNRETYAYCYIGTEKPNHDVVIIGWDDNYSKDNFTSPLEGDGAFICQNSWGDGFGDGGVFYVSYYDTNIGTHNVAYTRVDDADNYDHIYQSDLCGWVGKIGYEKEEIYGANVYKAKGNEVVTAAGFYATAPDTKYRVYVVKNFVNENSFADMVQVAEGTLADAGYYTIDFMEEISVKAGEKYAVVVYLNTPGATHPLAIEYDNGDKYLDNINLEDGEGYISYSGRKFTNIKEKQECNLCIKAYTNNQ